MDESGVNHSLEQALLPGRDNPLLPTQLIANTGLGSFKLVGTLTGALVYNFNQVVGAANANDSASVSLVHTLKDLPVALIMGYDISSTNNINIVNGAVYKPFNLGYTAFTYPNGSIVITAWSTIVTNSVINVILRRQTTAKAGDTVQAISGTVNVVAYLFQRQDTQLLF